VSFVERETPSSSQSNAWQSITFMEAYSKFSFEELRFSDYAIAATSNGDMTEWPRILSGQFGWCAACGIRHNKTESTISEMRDIERKLFVWKTVA
jgi:hypothetical protein